MTHIAKQPRRRRAGAAQLDLTNLRRLLRDDRLWCVLARVDLHAGQLTHFRIGVDRLGRRECLVDVVTTPGAMELCCRLACDAGVWKIPAIGTEVYVDLPDGQVDFVPAIVAVKSSVPAGVAEDVAVIAVAPGATLLVHDGNDGDAVPLALKSDVDGLADYVRAQFDVATGHVHPTPAGPTTPGITEGSITPPSTTAVPTADGTATLRSK